MATTVEIPRIEDETPRAYQARVEYITAGAERSLEKLRQRIGNRSVRYLETWSTRYQWVEHARRYDDTVAGMVAQDAADAYRRDLDEYRTRYQKAGKDLHTVAQGMLTALAHSIRGKTIEGKDGQMYTIPAVEMTTAALGQVKAAFQTAADLEALALRVEHLLGQTDHAELGSE